MRVKRKTISGIYKIVNTINNKYYVGSSKDILTRWSQHSRRLRHNIHNNPILQKAYNKYTKEYFRLEVVESDIPINSLLTIEQKYLDVAKSEREKSYNVKFTTDIPKRPPKDKSELNKTGRSCDPTVLIFRRGIVKFVGTRNQFKQYSQLDDVSIHNLVKGYRGNVAGWICESIIYKPKPKRDSYWGLSATYEDGSIVYFCSLTFFCKENNLSLKKCGNIIDRGIYYNGLKLNYIFKTSENKHLEPLFLKLREAHIINLKNRTDYTPFKRKGKKYIYKNVKYDELIKLSYNLKRFILKRSKDSINYTMEDLIGCNILEFKQFLEKNIEEGLSWSNYKSGGLRLCILSDPSEFDLSTKEGLNSCFHYKNFQLSKHRIKRQH